MEQPILNEGKGDKFNARACKEDETRVGGSGTSSYGMRGIAL